MSSDETASISAHADNVSIPAEDLILFSVNLLVARKVPERLARLVADALVDADLEGLRSHGVMLLPMYLDRIAAGSVSPAQEGNLVSDSNGAVVIDANNGLGQVTSARAVQLAVERAQQFGVATVAVRNGFHFGAAGRWASLMADEGCIGIASCNTRPLMPAHGGAEPIVGNNPLAIGFPSSRGPNFLIDFALSAAAMGKIRLAAASRETIPDGWATDEHGAPTTDPVQAISGMLLPAAGAKGFGLAVAIDLICGGLSAGAVGSSVRPLYGDPAEPYRCSHFFLALNVGSFVDEGAFNTMVAEYVQRIRESQPAPGIETVMAPGDPAIRHRQNADGTCCLPRATVESLLQAAEILDTPIPKEFR